MKHILCAAVACVASIASTPAVALSGAGDYLYRDADGNEIPVYYYVPTVADENQAVVIVLHGLKRDAEEYRDSWISTAEKYGLKVLAPSFTRTQFPGANGYNLGQVFHAASEDELKGKTKPATTLPADKWSFAVPDQVFQDFSQRVPVTDSGYTLYGHGAGAQFAHRYALFKPTSKACRVIAANSGWYTFPDRNIEWPYGLQGVEVLDEATLNQALSSNLWLFIGAEDTARSGVLRLTDEADAQGENRKARGENFFHYGQQLAQERNLDYGWQIHFVTDAAHRNQQMQDDVAQHISRCATP